MLFQRLSYKTDLINTMVAQSYKIKETLEQGGEVPDNTLVGVCEVRIERYMTILQVLSC